MGRSPPTPKFQIGQTVLAVGWIDGLCTIDDYTWTKDYAQIEVYYHCIAAKDKSIFGIREVNLRALPNYCKIWNTLNGQSET